MDAADEVASGAQAAGGDGATKRQRIEHLIQRGDRLANEQQQRQSKAQCTLHKSSSRKAPKSSAATQVFTARRSSWTPQEDEKLRKLVLQLGTQSWSEIAAHFPSRDRKRCRERFVNYVAVKSTAWTAQDDEKLLQMQQTMGSQWAKMAKQLGDRSPESVKNRCLLLARRAADTRLQSMRRAPQKWTAAEKYKLKELVTAHGARNWLFIASQLPGRTDMQCLQQWHRTLDDKVVKGKGTWTQSEDLVLVDKVTQVGRKWTEVAAFLPGRTGNQCRERFMNHLDPSIRTTSWTAAEEAILTEAVVKHSTRWGLIAEKLPGRSENAIKNHWYSRERRRMLAEASTAAPEMLG